MKKTLFRIILGVLLLGLMILCCYGYLLFLQPSRAVVTDIPVHIEETCISPANLKQRNTAVLMGAYNGKLYLVPGKGSGIVGTKYQDCLCVLGEQGLTILLDLRKENLSPLVIADGYLYLTRELDCDLLFSYSLESGELREVLSLESLPEIDKGSFSRYNNYRGEDGRLCFIGWTQDSFDLVQVYVSGNEVLRYGQGSETYRLGGREYSLRRVNSGYDVVSCRDADGQEWELPLENALNRSLIPTDHGLLIHNMRTEGRGVMLYYVTEDGELIELFSAPQLSSRSAVAVYHDTVYFSFMRSEKYGEIGYLGFENDELIGTWRISLADYSAEKLSSKIFDGLYIFDDSGIYACDCYCNVYKLDYDGNCIDTILEIRFNKVVAQTSFQTSAVKREDGYFALRCPGEDLNGTGDSEDKGT